MNVNRNRKQAGGSRLDPAKLRALTDEDLDSRIEAVERAVKGITSDDPAIRAAFAKAVDEVGQRKGVAYPKVLKQLQIEKRRRARLQREAMVEAIVSPPAWTPFERSMIDPASFDTEEAWARYRKLAENDPRGRTPEDYRAIYSSMLNDEIYLNSRYQVTVRRTNTDDGEGGTLQMVHLSIKRIDQLPIRDWRDMQRIKNELVGPNCEGVELYPAEDRVVDTANQYHIWCVNSGTYRFPFGWNEGTVRLDADKADGTGAKQRAFEE